MKYRVKPDKQTVYRVLNFDPIKHPRDPRTGKFVERPYPVPNDISDLPTQQIIADLWADDPDFADNLDEIAVDMGEIGPQTVDSILEQARSHATLMTGPRAERRDIFENANLDMSFEEFESNVQELQSEFPLDSEGAALAIVNSGGDVLV